MVITFSLLVFAYLDLPFTSATKPKNKPISEDKYCKLKCGTLNHTMCTNHIPKDGPPSECQDFIGGLTEDEKRLLQDLHNEKRRSVAVGEISKQPLSANMMKLEWDDEAALIAQRWADQCRNYEHDLCRITLAGEELGQNLQLIVLDSRTDAMRAVLNKWFEQHDHFNTKLIGDYEKALDSGASYTQLVWANTTRVGCGFAAQEKQLDDQYKLVCNYLPTGLIDGEEIYRQGTPCTGCPEGTHCSNAFPGLCTSDPDDKGKSSAMSVCFHGSICFVLIHFVIDKF